MHYKRTEPIGTTAPRGLDPGPADQVISGRPSDPQDTEAFWKSISLQAAARADAFAMALAAGPQPQGRDQLDLEGHVSPHRSSKLALALAIGIAVFACVTYFMLGRNLPPPLPSPL
jgi:hypothetical protein